MVVAALSRGQTATLPEYAANHLFLLAKQGWVGGIEAVSLHNHIINKGFWILWAF